MVSTDVNLVPACVIFSFKCGFFEDDDGGGGESAVPGPEGGAAEATAMAALEAATSMAALSLFFLGRHSTLCDFGKKYICKESTE